jgi:hypothetical protein
MKLITLRVPKISDSPAATKKSSMPLINPPVVCVTRQEADAKHASIACKSNGLLLVWDRQSLWRRGSRGVEIAR